MREKKSSDVVLIVDDDDLVGKALTVSVESMGYLCLFAGDGMEALAMLQSTKIDLVLTDLIMPGMDGLELLARIRQDYRNTDVIVSTGHHDKTSYAEVIRAGATDFIIKPIDLAELEAKLTRAVRERQMIRELEKLSHLDGLTSLNNRRSYDEQFSHELDRAHRQKYPLMLGIIDVDNFKKYNDLYGHQEGDKVLIGLAEVMRECTRESVDVCCRLGGDEFALLLPQTTPLQGKKIVERIRRSFAERNFDAVTLSIGLVACRRNTTVSPSDDDTAIKNLADQAMYEAKKGGKNCVVIRE